MKKMILISSIACLVTFSLGYLTAIHVYAIHVDHKSNYINEPAILTKNIEVKSKYTKLIIPKGSPITLHKMSGIDSVIQMDIFLPLDVDVFKLSKENNCFELEGPK